MGFWAVHVIEGNAFTSDNNVHGGGAGIGLCWVHSMSGWNSHIVINIVDAGHWGINVAIVVHSNEFVVEFIPLLDEVRSD